MRNTYEIYDMDSGLEYVKTVCSSVFENLQRELNAMDITEKDYTGVVKYKKEKLVEKTAIDVFEMTGEDVVFLNRRDDGVISVRKYLTYQKELCVSGKYKVIEDRSIFYCPNLETLIFDEGVEYIGEYAFHNKTTIKKAVFSKTTNIISNNAFENCSVLEDVVFLNTKTNITPSAFYGTKWLGNFTDEFVVVNSQLLKYNGNAENIIIPEGICEIKCCVFENNKKIKSVVCPSTLKIIGVASFYGCTNLEKVVLNNGIDTIEAMAFEECVKLKELVLPESMEHFCCQAVDVDTKVVFRDVNTELSRHIKKWFENFEIIQ